MSTMPLSCALEVGLIKWTERLVVNGAYVSILRRQFLHKHIKCKHQHSGRGLLLTISTSVGKYLYAGELR